MMNCGHDREYWETWFARHDGYCEVCYRERGYATLDEAYDQAYDENTVRSLLPALISALRSNTWLANKMWDALDEAHEECAD